MKQSATAQATVLIPAPPEKVWRALTKPQLSKQLVAELMTDWQVNSPIIYSDTRNGCKHTGKGKVLKRESGKLLLFTFWNSADGLADLPENYRTVQYDLCPHGSGTRLTITFGRQTVHQNAGSHPLKKPNVTRIHH